jgi:hypothetical protein
MLREAANRELALEVAALRLARWPSIKRVERWLAGGQGPPTGGDPPSPTATGTRGGGPPPAAARPATVAEALWADHPRLAGAIEAAHLTRDGETLTVVFTADAQALAKYVDSEAIRPTLESACKAVYPGTVEVRVEAGQDQAGASMSGLLAEVENDPGVALARSIIGGEIVGVRPDNGR